MRIGKRLREFRNIVGLTGTDVAREYGCTRQNISAIERSKDVDPRLVTRYLDAAQRAREAKP